METQKQVSYNATRAVAIALACLAALATMGCGASSSSPSTSSAVAATTVSGTGTDAECAGFSASGATLGGNIATFYNNGPNYPPSNTTVRVLINSVGADFAPASTEYIQMFRWRDPGSGAIIDQNPVPFTVVNASTGAVLLSSANAISGTDLTTLQSYEGSNSSSGTTLLSQVEFLVTNVDLPWQALKIVQYTETGAVIGSADMLLPAYLANPNEYAASHPLDLLQLHPFYYQMSESYSDAQWAQMDLSYCF
jgi:hypothetical protein